MKKLMIVAVMALISFTASAQEGFKLGGFVGLPVGDAGNVSSFGAGLDAKYLFSVSDEFNVGFATGYTNYFSKELEASVGTTSVSVDLPNVQFIPLAASAQYMIADQISLGLDLGYALGVNDGNDGGFYYRPGVGYGISETVELGLSYSGVSLGGGSWSSINLGVLFTL